MGPGGNINDIFDRLFGQPDTGELPKQTTKHRCVLDTDRPEAWRFVNLSTNEILKIGADDAGGFTFVPASDIMAVRMEYSPNWRFVHKPTGEVFKLNPDPGRVGGLVPAADVLIVAWRGVGEQPVGSGTLGEDGVVRRGEGGQPDAADEMPPWPPAADIAAYEADQDGRAGGHADPEFLGILEEIEDLHRKKAADYGRGTDPLANIRASEQFGVPAWQGAVLRANDKMHRIQSFIINGVLKNESVEDSLIDLANYAILGLKLYRERVRAETADGPMADAA